MDPGMTESQVRTELGAPHAAVDTGKGTQRWVYSMQPFGQEVWWIEFDADGRIVRREEVLDRAHMALIKPGVSTEKDVWNLFGILSKDYQHYIKRNDPFEPETCENGNQHQFVRQWIENFADVCDPIVAPRKPTVQNIRSERENINKKAQKITFVFKQRDKDPD